MLYSTQHTLNHLHLPPTHQHKDALGQRTLHQLIEQRILAIVLLRIGLGVVLQRQHGQLLPAHLQWIQIVDQLLLIISHDRYIQLGEESKGEL